MEYKTLDLRMFSEIGAPASAGDGMTADVGSETAPETILFGKEPPARQAPVQQEAAPVEKDLAKAFDELINGEYKDEYTKRTQKMIDTRFKQTKALEKQSEQLQPVLDALGMKYGIDLSAKDSIQKLRDAVAQDESYFEDEAERRGMTVSQLRETEQAKRENARLNEQLREIERQRARDDVYAGWMQDGDQLKQVYPGFDLRAEVQNEQFVRLLANGVDMRTAYEVIHKDELMSGAIQYAVNTAQKRTMDNIRANGMRPRENGSGRGTAPTQIRKADPSAWTDAELEEVTRRAKSGEKIYL